MSTSKSNSNNNNNNTTMTTVNQSALHGGSKGMDGGGPLAVLTGSGAAALGAYSFSDQVFLYPSAASAGLTTPGSPAGIAPSAAAGSEAIELAAAGRVNSFGKVPVVHNMVHEEGTASGVVDAFLNQGQTASAVTGSASLQEMLPNLFDLVAQRIPAVFHVSAQNVVHSGSQSLELLQQSRNNASAVEGEAEEVQADIDDNGAQLVSDLADVISAAETGITLLASAGTQEIHDFSIIAHVVAQRTQSPIMHFFDGSRVAHEACMIHTASSSELSQVVEAGENLMLQQLSSTNTSHRHQHQPQIPPPYNSGHSHGVLGSHEGHIIDTMQGVMDELAENVLNGRNYHIFEYYGAPDAECVVIAMGMTAQIMEEAVRYIRTMTRSKSKIGILKVRLLRPWSNRHFLEALPTSARRVCVLDVVNPYDHNANLSSGPLFMDVASAFHAEAQWVTPMLLNGRVVSTTNQGFLPGMALAVFSNMESQEPMNNFNVASLPQYKQSNMLPSSVEHPTSSTLESSSWSGARTASQLTRQVISWNYKRSVGSGKEPQVQSLALRTLTRIFGIHLGLQVQQLDTVDAKTLQAKSDSNRHISDQVINRSELRFGPLKIESEYPVEQADCIVCDSLSLLLLPQYAVTSAFRDGSIMVINCPYTTEREIERELTASVKHEIATHNVKLYTIDASQIVDNAGCDESAIEWVMVACLMMKCESVTYRQAYKQLAKAISKTLPSSERLIQELQEKLLRTTHLRHIKYSKDAWFNASRFGDRSSTREPAISSDSGASSDEGKSDTSPPETGFSHQTHHAHAHNHNHKSHHPVAPSRGFLPSALYGPSLIEPNLLTPNNTVGHPHEKHLNETSARSIGHAAGSVAGNHSFADGGVSGGTAASVTHNNHNNNSSTRYNSSLYQQQPQGSATRSSHNQIAASSKEYESLLEQVFGSRLAVANTNAGDRTGVQGRARLVSPENPTGSLEKYQQITSNPALAAINTSYTPPPPPPSSSSSSSSSSAPSSSSSSVEDCYGLYLATLQRRRRLAKAVREVLDDATVPKSHELRVALASWLDAKDDSEASKKHAKQVIAELNAPHAHTSQWPRLKYILDNKELLVKPSKWIVGGDRWSHDVAGSGVHHVLASGEDINLLVLDTEVPPTLFQNSTGSSHIGTEGVGTASSESGGGEDASDGDGGLVYASAPTKKDLGLYAMNYGGVYVASISLSASHTQALQAVKEADEFPGPSLIIAHAPAPSVRPIVKTSNGGNALPNQGLLSTSSSFSVSTSDNFKMSDETAISRDIAVESVRSGHWPLYRWNPLLESKYNQDPFTLDSQKLKSEISEFVKLEQQLTLMASKEPKIPDSLSKSLEGDLGVRAKKAKEATDHRRLHDQFERLAGSLGDQAGGGSGSGSSNPQLNLLVLYGSDGGNGASVAETIAKKAELSGCGETRCMEANEYSVDNLEEEENVVMVLSTAGQGEDCGNAKDVTSQIHELQGKKLTKMNYAVFGLGDSHYWGEGTADSAKYFCKPARDMDSKLHELGANQLVETGLGDDQADDGHEGALEEWENKLWEALGVTIPESAKADLGGAPVIVDDDLKKNSNFLRGMIQEGLNDPTTGKLLPEDTKLTKFHGIYQQDDREEREERDKQGIERAYQFMIRIGIPGGVSTTEQYLAMDNLVNKYATGKLKCTTRQAYQFHGVLKKNLKTTMQGINRALMDTLAACGDVNRNVIANPYIRDSEVNRAVGKLANDLSTHLKPRTSAYHEIWLDKKKVAGSVDVEPIYGPTYLPRKFKIALAVPPLNDVDVYAHCLGYIAIVERGRLVGYNVTVGGGMGVTHGNKATYPRLADVMGFCTPEQAVSVGEQVVTVQRDYGERENRKHARLKYTVEDYGVEWFRKQVEERCGFKLGEPRPYKFDTNIDQYGWHRGIDGKWDFVMYVENGLIVDRPGLELKKGLREIAEYHTGGEFSLTANQNVIIGGIPDGRKPHIEQLLRKWKIDNTQYSQMRVSSMACVALPTCALAMAESQRYLPTLIGKIEETLDELGLSEDQITIRMTGCPNGCARPYVAEIALVGKAPGQYNLHLGGGFAGNRVNKVYKEGINEDEILGILRPMLRHYVEERKKGEKFGDFVIRKGYVMPVLNGHSTWETDPKENDLRTKNAALNQSSAEGALQVYW